MNVHRAKRVDDLISIYYGVHRMKAPEQDRHALPGEASPALLVDQACKALPSPQEVACDNGEPVTAPRAIMLPRSKPISGDDRVRLRAEYEPQSNSAVEATPERRHRRPLRDRGYAPQSNVPVESPRRGRRRQPTYVTESMKELIGKGLREHALPGVSMINVYQRTMVNEFECMAIKGTPYPTYRQFVYWAKKLSSQKVTNRKLLRG